MDINRTHHGVCTWARIALLGILAIAFLGCATMHTIMPGEPYAYQGKGKLVTRDSTFHSISRAEIKGDSLVFALAQNTAEQSLLLSSIDRLELTRHGRGALEGVGFGFLTGFFGGLIVAAASPCHRETICVSDLAPAIGLMTGLVIGVPGGAILGGVVGKRVEIRFANPSDSLMSVKAPFKRNFQLGRP